jgi:hypothetical protein
VTPFARNFATGTKGSTAVGAGIALTWNSIDVGTDPSTDVPITPITTGEVLVTGVITLNNPTGAPILATIQVQVDGSAVATFSATTIAAGAEASIPFVAEAGVLSLAQHIVTVTIDGNGLTTVSDGSSINVEEVPLSTG